MKSKLSLAFGLTCLTALPVFADSHEAAPVGQVVEPASQWQFSVTPFIWATAMSGEIGVGPVTANVDLDFSTIIENLDMTAMLDFRARNGDWEYGFNLVYADLSASVGDRVDSTIGAKTTIIEMDAKYYYNESTFAYFGGRYYDIGSSVSIDAPISASGSTSLSWVDPIVGGGFAAPLSEKWSFVGKADIGGFGLGSDFSWQAQAYFQYQSSDKISFLIGYRHLDFDYTSNNTRIDLAMTGPVLGLRINF